MFLTFCLPNNYLVQNNLRCFRTVKRCLYENFKLRKSWAMKQRQHVSSGDGWQVTGAGDGGRWQVTGGRWQVTGGR